MSSRSCRVCCFQLWLPPGRLVEWHFFDSDFVAPKQIGIILNAQGAARSAKFCISGGRASPRDLSRRHWLGDKDSNRQAPEAAGCLHDVDCLVDLLIVRYFFPGVTAG
jgi:hypothetical protein